MPRPHPHAESLRTLKSIKLHENGDPLVDLNAYPFILKPGILPFVRKEVAERLLQAQRTLPNGYLFFIVRALRTPAMQQKHWEAQYKKLETAHPFWPASIVHRATNRIFAPHNHQVPPGHCTGGAIDVVLTNAEGKLFDVVPPLTDWTLGYTASKKVHIAAQHRRKILLQAMETAGFSNYPFEYWHFSYGDAAWAARRGRKTCMYGLINESETLQKAISEEMAEK